MFSKISTFTAAVTALLAASVVPAFAQTTKPSSLPTVTKLPTTPIAPRNLLPPPPVTAPPPGVSVTMQNCSLVPGDGANAPYSIGMASTFNLNTTSQAGPAAGTWAGAQVGTGTIQFVAGNNLPMLLAECNAQRILPRMTITNVTSTGTVVYTMPNVLLTNQQVGSAITYSFDYIAMDWTMYSPGGTWVSALHCQYDGQGGQRGCR
jgi:hypothetical protein